MIRERFEKILKEGKDILHIAFSSALSGSCNNVVVTANELLEDYPDRKIRVFDSLNASLGEGVSVYRAVELWKAGKSMDEVYDILTKPILKVTAEGELKSDGTVRGRKKSLKTLVSRMEATLDLEHYGKDRMVAVLHGDCIDEAKNVADMVKELGFTNVIINDVSPSIGTHAGPGVVGLVHYGQKR